jgi:hypothetical protein
MEFFALQLVISCPEKTRAGNFVPGIHRAGTLKRRKKPLVFLPGKQQLLASYDPIAPNSIDMLRDGTSFPESCGEGCDIGSVLETVNSARRIRFVGAHERFGSILVFARVRLRVPFIESAS